MSAGRIGVLAACLSFVAVAALIALTRWVWARLRTEADALRELFAEESRGGL